MSERKRIKMLFVDHTIGISSSEYNLDFFKDFLEDNGFTISEDPWTNLYSIPNNIFHNYHKINSLYKLHDVNLLIHKLINKALSSFKT